MADIFVPESKPEDALVGPLSTITYVTADPQLATKMLVDGLGLSASEWIEPGGDNRAALNKYFGFNSSDGWKVRKLSRTGAGKNIQIRLVAVNASKPQVRPELNGAYLGGLSIGFPMNNTDERESHMSALGFPSVVGVKRLEFSSPTGETYTSEEVHFPGPENVYVLGVKRPDVFVPVGPIDPDVDIGAPAYSAQCVIDADATMKFYNEVLGYEIRRDMTMTVGDNSGLKLKEGSPERFIQAFAPGASTGYLVFLNHPEEAKTPDPKPGFGTPSRGMCMWSFPTADLDAVHQRAITAGIPILQPPGRSSSPFLPDTNTMIIEDPGGFPLEIYATS